MLESLIQWLDRVAPLVFWTCIGTFTVRTFAPSAMISITRDADTPLR